MSHSPVCRNGKHCFIIRTRVEPLESHFLDLTYNQWSLDMTESARKTARMIMIILMVILLLLLLRNYRWSIILRCVACYIVRCLFWDKERGWNDPQYFKLVLHIDKCQEIRCGTNATCTNTKGSLRCTCNTGFYGDGYNCTGKPVSLPTRLKAIAKDSNTWSLSETTPQIWRLLVCHTKRNILSPSSVFFFFKN